MNLNRGVAENTEETTDAVTLITLHNTKGLEFPRVIITGLENGIFPRGDKAGDELEEERRLFYVGITRAKDELYITSCAMRRLYGRTEPMMPSRFLFEAGDVFKVLGNVPPSYAFAAKTAGVKTVIVPEENRSDVEEFDEEITGGLSVIYAQDMKQVLACALVSK